MMLAYVSHHLSKTYLHSTKKEEQNIRYCGTTYAALGNRVTIFSHSAPLIHHGCHHPSISDVNHIAIHTLVVSREKKKEKVLDS